MLCLFLGADPSEAGISAMLISVLLLFIILLFLDLRTRKQERCKRSLFYFFKSGSVRRRRKAALFILKDHIAKAHKGLFVSYFKYVSI